jgi:PhzF family phenazine biosynthesis protein
MRINLYQVDAFAQLRFEGNPAAVCPPVKWLEESVLQAIAEENNLSETTFFAPSENGFRLRWFTPSAEVAEMARIVRGRAK